MAFENFNEHTEDLQKESRSYIESTIAYYKLKVFKVSVQSVALILKIFLVGLFFSVLIIFFSVAIALFIGESLESYSLGFFIVGIFYFIVTILIFIFSKKIVDGPILRSFSKIFLN